MQRAEAGLDIYVASARSSVTVITVNLLVNAAGASELQAIVRNNCLYFLAPLHPSQPCFFSSEGTDIYKVTELMMT